MSRRWFALVLVVVALGGGIWLLVRSSGSGRRELSVGQVAARVEQIRGLRFVRLPTFEVVSDATLRAIIARELPPREVGAAASDFVRRVPGGELALIERLEALELLGAAPVGTTIAQILYGAVDPAGLFDRRSGEILCVASAAAVGAAALRDAAGHLEG